MQCLSLQFCSAFGNTGSHTAEWSECVWELELSVLTWNKSRLWRCRTCFGPFSLYFLWSTWLHCCLSLSLSSEMWKLSNRPSPAMCGCLGVQEWWETSVCGGAGGGAGREAELLNWLLCLFQCFLAPRQVPSMTPRSSKQRLLLQNPGWVVQMDLCLPWVMLRYFQTSWQILKGDAKAIVRGNVAI